MDALQQQVRNLLAEVQQARAEAAAANSAAANAGAAAQAEATAAAAATVGGKGGQPQHLDLRALRSLDGFDGTQKAWRDWSLVVRNYAALVDPCLPPLMQAAEAGTADVMNSLMDPANAAASEKLYFLLIVSCKGQALDRLVNAGNGQGVLGWRFLCEKYEPRARTRQAGLLQQLLGWSFAGNVTERLEAWERDLSSYEQLSGETISDGIKIGVCLRQMEEGALRSHLIFNSERLKVYKDFRMELLSVRAAFDTCTPMDVGALQSKFQGNCNICGKFGHRASECRSGKGNPKSGKGNPKGSGGKGAGGQGGGKYGGGKGGKHDGKGKGNCFVCGKPGHRASQCRQRRPDGGVRGVEDDAGASPSSSSWAAPPPPAQPATPTTPAGGDGNVGALDGLFLTTFELESSFTPQHRQLMTCTPCGQPRTLQLGVDSGASVTVIKEDECVDYPIDTSKRNTYRSACKQQLQTLGLRTLKTRKGKFLRAEVGPVSKNLLCVAELCDSGHRVVFDNYEGNYAVHKKKNERMDFVRMGKTYNVEMEVMPYDGPSSGFQRQGRYP